MENQDNIQPQEPTQPGVTSPVLDEGKLLQYREALKLEQNLPMAIIGGLLAAFVGALIWAIITVSTGYQIGYMALGVGLLVGYTVKFTGKGIDAIFGLLGAVSAFLGCLLGNFFSLIGFAANEEGLGYMELLGSIDYNLLPEIMAETFSPMDLLFYGIAVYEGYRFSFRTITEEELIANATKQNPLN